MVTDRLVVGSYSVMLEMSEWSMDLVIAGLNKRLVLAVFMVCMYVYPEKINMHSGQCEYI